jgi:hypothetical protein
MLEAVISLETFLSVEWRYAELAMYLVSLLFCEFNKQH